MDRHAQQPSPRRGAASLRTDQQEAYDGLLLALLARKRLMVLAGGTGAERTDVFARVIGQVAADGSLVLPVVAQHGMQVEDLVAAAADAAGIRPAGEEADFDALVGELESQLDLAGSGLLAVDDAHLLAPATLADLADLSRAETASGRFVQILLSGAPELERLLSRPALQQAVRDLGVIYRLIGGAPPSAAPQEHDDAAVTPISFARTHRPPVAVAESLPEPEARPASEWTVPPSLGVAPPRRGRAGAWAVAALALAVAGAGAMVAVQPFGEDMDMDFDRTAADLRGKADALWTDAGAAVGAWSRDTFGWPPGGESAENSDALALERSRYPALADLAPATLPPATLPPTNLPLAEPHTGERVAALPPPVQSPAGERPHPRPPAAEPPAPAPMAPAPLVPPLPRSESAPDAGPLPPTIPWATAPQIAPVPLPDLPPPPAAPPAVAVAPAPTPGAPPQNAAPAEAATERVQALVEQARRQIASKRLTTPPGDNANETVQRLRELAPDSPEIPALVAAMVDTYRRWAAYAEKDGNSSEARRYLERALAVSPDDPALRAQLKGETTAAKPEPAKLSPSDAADVFADQEATLAILGQPAALRAALAAGHHDPNKRLENGKTPLMLAAEAGLRDAARQLLERGANANLRTRDGATAIMYAAWNGRDEIVAMLADAGANVNAGNDDGKTALMAAAARGHAGVARALLARGAAVDRAANHGWTALMYAAHAGNEAVVRLLVDAGANPNRTDQMGNSAITLGRQQGHTQVVGTLMGR
ncbi:ankyrin repeat domain-containing protein [Azospirillum sp. TSO22-1]|uniref:ankyrin repeat domain-containing protein n=1 Tax=Azospirillum sp. TSO22-1 TaxID=716789 RepID=UPI001304F3AB|nr:ankyrin repeat domain-containing protein [Azospirillum sp. TSO22-1]